MAEQFSKLPNIRTAIRFPRVRLFCSDIYGRTPSCYVVRLNNTHDATASHIAFTPTPYRESTRNNLGVASILHTGAYLRREYRLASTARARKKCWATSSQVCFQEERVAFSVGCGHHHLVHWYARVVPDSRTADRRHTPITHKVDTLIGLLELMSNHSTAMDGTMPASCTLKCRGAYCSRETDPYSNEGTSAVQERHSYDRTPPSPGG